MIKQTWTDSRGRLWRERVEGKATWLEVFVGGRWVYGYGSELTRGEYSLLFSEYA
jgi:hypothetical protein